MAAKVGKFDFGYGLIVIRDGTLCLLLLNHEYPLTDTSANRYNHYFSGLITIPWN